MNRSTARKYNLRHNLNHPRHSPIASWPEMTHGQVVRVPEPRRHLDGSIPVSARFEVRLKLGDTLGILLVILRVGVECRRVAGRV